MLRVLRPGSQALLAKFASVQTRSVVRVVDRPLPDVLKPGRRNRLYFMLFSGTMAAALFALIKYEDASSPIVTSTYLALRQSPLARESLGENIRYKTSLPWITGSPGIAGNTVDFSYPIVGDNGTGRAHFRAEKRDRKHFAVTDWFITKDQSGEKISLKDEDFVPEV